jgi:hypothetical protein
VTSVPFVIRGERVGMMKALLDLVKNYIALKDVVLMEKEWKIRLPIQLFVGKVWID